MFSIEQKSQPLDFFVGHKLGGRRKRVTNFRDEQTINIIVRKIG